MLTCWTIRQAVKLYSSCFVIRLTGSWGSGPQRRPWSLFDPKEHIRHMKTFIKWLQQHSVHTPKGRFGNPPSTGTFMAHVLKHTDEPKGFQCLMKQVAQKATLNVTPVCSDPLCFECWMEAVFNRTNCATFVPTTLALWTDVECQTPADTCPHCDVLAAWGETITIIDVTSDWLWQSPTGFYKICLQGNVLNVLEASIPLHIFNSLVNGSDLLLVDAPTRVSGSLIRHQTNWKLNERPQIHSPNTVFKIAQMKGKPPNVYWERLSQQ